MRRACLLIAPVVGAMGCAPERVPPSCCAEAFAAESEDSEIEVGGSARYEIRFIGTGPRTEERATMTLRVLGGDLPDATAYASVDCGPFAEDADHGWTSEMPTEELAGSFDLYAVMVPFELQCALDLHVEPLEGPEREPDEQPPLAELSWLVQFEMHLEPPPHDEPHRARIDIDRLD